MSNSTNSNRSSFSIGYDEGAQLTVPERNNIIPRLERQAAEISPPSSRRVTFSKGPTVFGENVTETNSFDSEDSSIERQKTFHYQNPETLYKMVPNSTNWSMIGLVVILLITLILIILFATKTITMLSVAADIVIVSFLAFCIILMGFYYNNSKKTISRYIKKR